MAVLCINRVHILNCAASRNLRSDNLSWGSGVWGPRSGPVVADQNPAANAADAAHRPRRLRSARLAQEAEGAGLNTWQSEKHQFVTGVTFLIRTLLLPAVLFRS